MTLDLLFNSYHSSSKVLDAAKQLQKPYQKLLLKGLIGSGTSFVTDALFKHLPHHFLLIFPDKESAAFHHNDLELFINQAQVLFYPSSYKRPYQVEQTDNANILLRAEVLNKIARAKQQLLIVTYPEALFEQVITQKTLQQNTLSLHVGETLSVDFVNETLFEYGFVRVDFVSEPGEFSLRGGIIDVFSYAHDEPYRIEFFGNEIDSIRTFDIETQMSVKTQTQCEIVSNIEQKKSTEARQTFFDFINSETVIFIDELQEAVQQLNEQFVLAQNIWQGLSQDIKKAKPEQLFCDGVTLLNKIETFKAVELGNKSSFNEAYTIDFMMQPQPSFNKQFEVLIDHLKENYFNGLQNYLLCSSNSQVKRFEDIFENIKTETHQDDLNYQSLVLPIHQGFLDVQHQLACYTDHQIFERYHKFQLKNVALKKQSLSLKDLNQLEIGDYVTHIDHGIGKFGGLQKIEVNGQKQEAIKLVYAENDIVYVSIHALHKIAKYNGKEGTAPKIYKLGSKAWKAVKEKTKSRIKKMAFDLIQLYAKRTLQKGHAFAPDSYLQKELESSFIYEDTPDQLQATLEVKQDMEQEKPMDRLVCGDVGFGKTEVAIRAAFKAVDNSKQVAVLVPTTILAYQHYRTFSERMKGLPVKIEYLNRFKSAKQKTQILKDLASGQCDIIIGTHQLVSKSVQFKDLGLLVIDEEQKFGVNVKDKLKTIAPDVDTLTLTATPIPRTLQFSLMAARDLSVIKTPPPNRYPIESLVIRWSEEQIRDAISYELQRGGQVFFIHNRVDNINEIAGIIQRLVPDAKIAIGHGQLNGQKLEEIMLSFIEGAYDVLVSTTIIESGLDVPNANTIFINNAQNFGLSDLHQMRGRVGRSNKKAFCYFIAPPYHQMTEDARKRIQAVEQYRELGSGIHIAMKDLEIRGAGDLLGGEQSGFINDIGFETYQKIMQEAVDELKEKEFKDLYEQDPQKSYVKDFTIDTDFELMFPDDYINSVTERLNLYNKLSQVSNLDTLQAYLNELTDRFGPLPKPSVDLLKSVEIKWLAQSLGLEKIILKEHKMIGYFISNQESAFYNTASFIKIMQFVHQHPKLCTIKEKQTKQGLRLLLTFEGVKTIQKAFENLKIIEAFLHDV